MLVIDVSDVVSVVALVVAGWCLVETLRRRQDIDVINGSLRHYDREIRELFEKWNRT